MVALSKETSAVYLLDDDPSILKATRRLLDSVGWKVEAFSDPIAFLEHAAIHCPELAVIDIVMPDMNGLELTRRLKSDPATRDIIVLALTAFAMQGDEERAIDAGCDGYITKPIDTRTFPALIRRFLHGSGAEASQKLSWGSS